jgi:hypothetical protein
MDIFAKANTWDVEKDELGQVSSINGGATNKFFREIKDTINKYIAGNTNSVMDFQIFKDAVERQCDSIENQIESQTPVPLYLGLSGSMIGIIVGLIALVLTGDFTKLVDGNQDSFLGIASLLLAVAIAMVASLCGIVMTIAITNEYKEKKSRAEDGKNTFISWMQSVLFPSLPNDISFAMTQLVEDLENFNTKFETNTSSLAHTFDNVNEAYKTQADIVEAVKDMDVQSMASANVRVLKQLETCTEKIERFNEYLDHIDGYTSTIQKFNEQFHQEESQLGLLREIRDFFKTELEEIEQRKNAIGDAVSSVDVNLKHALEELGSHSAEQSEQFKLQLYEQNKTYKEILDSQKESFTNVYTEIQQSLEKKLQEIPESLERLKDIAEIPGELKILSNNIQQSMERLSSNINSTLSHLKSASPSNQHIAQAPIIVKPALSKFEKTFGLCLMGVMAISSIGAAVFCALMYFNN